jgi:Acetyltransferase (GNAT) domain
MLGRNRETAEMGSSAASRTSSGPGSPPLAFVPISEKSPELILAERSFSSYRGDEWDNFASASGGSFLGSRGVIKARRLFGRVKLFDFLSVDGSRTRLKVGQCAVLIGEGKVTFLDKIQLLAAQTHLRDHCFELLTQQFGANTYHYGSNWNDEAGFELAGLPDFVTEAKTFHVDLIDFRDWADFLAYRRGVSENIRRDYRKAKDAGAIVETRFGLAALRDLFALVTMRAHMMRRSKQNFSWISDYFLHAAKLAILGKNGVIATARIKGRCYAAFFGAQFGSKLHYISGGTRKNRLGVGSYLFLTLIENWFSEHPTGKVLMGDCPGFCDPVTYTHGNLLYRRKLRVRSVNGVEFQLKVKNPVCID